VYRIVDMFDHGGFPFSNSVGFSEISMLKSRKESVLDSNVLPVIHLIFIPP
jgi:hypothetical protein